MRSLVAVLVLLAAACVHAVNPWEKAGSFRSLFVRNLLADTAFVLVVSDLDPDHRIFLKVAPADSACARFPFDDERSVAIVRVRTDQQSYGINASRPGLTWLLIGGGDAPELTVCR